MEDIVKCLYLYVYDANSADLSDFSIYVLVDNCNSSRWLIPTNYIWLKKPNGASN